MLLRALSVTPRSPTELVPEVPEEISETCLRALEKPMENRFETAAAFAEHLEDAARRAALAIAPARVVGEIIAALRARSGKNS